MKWVYFSKYLKKIEGFQFSSESRPQKTRKITKSSVQLVHVIFNIIREPRSEFFLDIIHH